MEAKVMIVVVEGPRCSGKSNFIDVLYGELKKRRLSAYKWKAIRGANPIPDMKNSLRVEFVRDLIYLLDRFHLTEWINSFALERGWDTPDQWARIESGLTEIDDELRIRNALIVLLTVDATELERRWELEDREDVDRDAGWVLYTWREAFDLTRCDIVHFRNDTPQMLIRNVNLAINLIQGRLLHENRMAHMGTGPVVSKRPR